MSAPLDEIFHAGGRGVIAAMAMTGMRTVTTDVGLVRKTPPRALLRDEARGLMRRVPRRYRRAATELGHWGVGAALGAGFAMLPDGVRRRPWAGPVYGLAVWAGFQVTVAPALGLVHVRRPKLAEQLAIAGDHALYGLVLSEGRAQPREGGS
ncbi:MAG: hypothetical protein QOF04_1839 [Solirubrobacteraceae bacterium]|jgi:hypothetical protein|nr:hypothetical protein [Solirubrobacteraceae bacterium]